MYVNEQSRLKGVLLKVDVGIGHYLSIEQVDILRESWSVFIRMYEWVSEVLWFGFFDVGCGLFTRVKLSYGR